MKRRSFIIRGAGLVATTATTVLAPRILVRPVSAASWQSFDCMNAAGQYAGRCSISVEFSSAPAGTMPAGTSIGANMGGVIGNGGVFQGANSTSVKSNPYNTMVPGAKNFNKSEFENRFAKGVIYSGVSAPNGTQVTALISIAKMIGISGEENNISYFYNGVTDGPDGVAGGNKLLGETDTRNAVTYLAQLQSESGLGWDMSARFAGNTTRHLGGSRLMKNVLPAMMGKSGGPTIREIYKRIVDRFIKIGKRPDYKNDLIKDLGDWLANMGDPRPTYILDQYVLRFLTGIFMSNAHRVDRAIDLLTEMEVDNNVVDISPEVYTALKNNPGRHYTRILDIYAAWLNDPDDVTKIYYDPGQDVIRSG